ncbi:MAG: S8 family serine peptidase [Ignavibacteriae bacterium]|nr:S8 family serine peptidase [Ignavibacteriota bacterium]
MKNLIKILLVIATVNYLFAQTKDQTFISLRNTGVEKFQEKYSDYDGRGTIILVLDTGVDMGVDGLTTTSTGDVKVIDVQDFTGQGNISFFSAEIDEENDVEYFVNEEKGYKVSGAGKLSLKADDDKYYIGVVAESLWKNSGSGVDDINGNGNKDDKFYFVTFQTQNEGEKFWVVYLDLNDNGKLDDEKPLRNYKEKFDAFTFPIENGLPGFTLGLNIIPENKIVSFYFDDGSHGTHCAGIAAGNRIGNNDFFGIAPGAKLMGLKIGNNNFAGGATVTESMKKAYLYADKISKERKEPCIINMSFGIGSEIEQNSEIEKFLDNLVKDNPYLYISTSNSNEGPGISTTGLPSSCSSVFSSGAVLAQEVGNDLYGTTLINDIVLHFSSRGGEVKKPDVVSPGACVSTVPNFSGADRFWGTSMASPYSAGVMSVLLGAAKAEFPDVKIPSRFLYKVLRESATKMEGYDFVDQGSGLINIEAAYNLLKKYIENGEIKNFETYTTKAFAPNMPNNTAQCLYVRDASFLTGNEKFSFRITRDNTINSDKFYRMFNLKSSAEWLTPVQKKIHIRNDQTTIVNATIDPKILEKPGLYNAKIYAVRADNSSTPEFELMATFAVPYDFNLKNHYNLNFESEKIMPGMHKRYFLKIPFGTSNLKVNISSKKNDYSSLRYYLHDPDGREKHFGIFNSEDNPNTAEEIYDLHPGVYELVVLGQFTSSKESIYNLDLEIDGINISKNSLSESNSMSLVNYFDKEKNLKISGKILGYTKSYKIEISGNNIYKIPFELKQGESKKEFKINLSKEDFNKVTDFALMIYDEKGNAVDVNGLSYYFGSSSVNKQNKLNNEVEKFEYHLIPGFANADSKLVVNICEKTYYDESEEITFNKENLNLFPFNEIEIKADYSQPKIAKEKGADYFAEIIFKSANTDEVEFKKVIKINSEE